MISDRGENDRETIKNIKKGKLSFDSDAFEGISEDCKDFMGKLLQFKPSQRMEVKAALNHPWMLNCMLQPRDPFKINTDRLRTYSAKFTLVLYHTLRVRLFIKMDYITDGGEELVNYLVIFHIAKNLVESFK